MRKLLTFSFAFAAAIFLSQYLLPRELMHYFGLGALALLLSVLFFKSNVRLRIMLLLFGISTGFLWNFGFESIVFSNAESLDGKEETVSAVVDDFPVLADYGAYIDVKVVIPDGPDLKARGYVYSDELSNLLPGDVIRFTADFSSADHVKDIQISSYVSKGIFLFASNVRDAEIISSNGSDLRYLHRYAAREIKRLCREVFPEETSAFMTALLTGDKIEYNEDEILSNDMARCGVTHIITVSGMHVSILAGFILTVFGRKKRSILIAAPVLLLFMGISGFSASVVRAVIMQMFVLLAPVINRENDSLTALSAALLVLLVINPYAVMGVGLQLSFAATLGIILFTSKINEFFRKHIKPQGKAVNAVFDLVFGSLSTTLGALLFTTPISAYYFGYVSLVAPIVNVLILWAVTPAFIIGAAAVAAGSISLAVGQVIGVFPSLLVKMIVSIVSFFSEFKSAAIYLDGFLICLWFVLTYLAILLFIVTKAKPRQLIAPVCVSVIALCAIFVYNTVSSTDGEGYTMTVLDVGQGQSIVVSSDNRTAVIDCGSTSGEYAGDITERFIRSHSRDSIDILILTHYHEDHAEGAIELLAHLDVKTLLAPVPDYDESALDEEVLSIATRRGTEVIFVDQPLEARLGDTVITLYPPVGKVYENERGVCMLVSENGFDTLITGDISTSSELQLLGKYVLPDIECLIVGHHGSKYSTSEALLKRLMPETAVISVGDNSYGHPTDEVLERLNYYDIDIYRTDVHGNVAVRSDWSCYGKEAD